MLSKPSLEPSAGSSVVTSTSSASRSRIALAYSVRFSRCSAGVARLAPGTAARSSALRAARRSRRATARSGAAAPLGGIMPVLILRTTFSHVSASAPTRVRSSASSARPAVFARWLWQVMQYCLRNAGSGDAVCADAVCADAVCAATVRLRPDTTYRRCVVSDFLTAGALAEAVGQTVTSGTTTSQAIAKEKGRRIILCSRSSPESARSSSVSVSQDVWRGRHPPPRPAACGLPYPSVGHMVGSWPSAAPASVLPGKGRKAGSAKILGPAPRRRLQKSVKSKFTSAFLTVAGHVPGRLYLLGTGDKNPVAPNTPSVRPV